MKREAIKLILFYLINKTEEIATFVIAFWLVKQLGII